MQNEQDRHLFMRCNAIDISAFGELPEGYHLRTCRPEELDIWYGFPFDTPVKIRISTRRVAFRNIQR